MVTGLRFTDSNLVLTGYIEPNKPRIGLQIAQQLQMPFVDVETQIQERIGEDTESIRKSFGERRLKSIEAELMEEVMLRRRAVIRVNGSTLAQGNHYERLQETSLVICLVARLDAILQRMHLTLGARFHNPSERALELGFLRRAWAVRQKEGIHEIDATYLDEESIIQAILDLWQEKVLSG